MADWGRLTVDANVIGYWGFDEANTTDPALDSASSPNNLILTNPVSVQPGRVGGSREFNGTSTFATPASSVSHRLSGDLTILLWAKADTFNLSGSLLRTLLVCDGPTAAAADNMLYGVFVDSNGALVYQHDQNDTTRVVVKTANGTIKQGRFHSICVVRQDAGVGLQNIRFYVDNVQKVAATVTVGGSPSSLPVPTPTDGTSSTLKFGKSKVSDSGWWDGLIDEASIHDVARPVQPYLLSAFYRVAFADPTTRVSVFDKITSVSSVDMQRGLRWWAYERDQSIYIVQEYPVGVFRPEVLLTTTPGLMPGGTSLPSLVYDEAADTLLVVFVNSGRVYKVTALADDAPVTQNMPYTADLPASVKAKDQDDYGRFGSGSSSVSTEDLEDRVTQTDFSVVKVFASDFGDFGSGGTALSGEEIEETSGVPPSPAGTALLAHIPTFGVLINAAVGDYGYLVYEVSGGMMLLLGTATLVNNSTHWHYPISSRFIGRSFVGVPLDSAGLPTGVYTNVVVDYMSDFVYENGAPVWRTRDDVTDSGLFGAGSGNTPDENWYEVVQQDQGVIKVPVADFDPAAQFGSGGSASAGFSSVEYFTILENAVVTSE